LAVLVSELSVDVPPGEDPRELVALQLSMATRELFVGLPSIP
jgi:hypothetical protein